MIPSWNTLHWFALSIVVASILSAPCRAADPTGKTLLSAAGVKGGLVVHVGCGDGRLTAALAANERFTVQGLDADLSQIREARAYLASLGCYGPVSARFWEDERLPYADNLVNLLVVDNGRHLAAGEIERVLMPRGCALVRGSLPAPPSGLLEQSLSSLDGWTKYVKRVPEDIDDWTHYLHDSGNNAVAEDERVGPPKHLQWKAGPMWSRSHEFASSVLALVSAQGRLIGVIDEGVIGQPRGVPALWALIARDAFNGIQLWRQPCDQINPHALAAVGERVYVTLKKRGPLSILDAATGDILHTCEQTGRVDEVSVSDGHLLLSTQLANDKGRWVPHVAAADLGDGAVVWSKPVQAVAKNTLVAGSGRVCYHNNRELVCLSLEDGEEIWRSESGGRGKGYAVLYNGVVFLTGGSTRAFWLETGSPLWTGPDGNPHARNPPGLFGANGLIWSAWDHVDPRSFTWQHRQETRNGYDPMTGEVRKTVTAERLVTAGHHIRCYPPKATKRYLLLNKRGVEFLDLESNEHMRANWTRGACGFGMLPANGLLYAPPAQCFCYQGVLLTGLNALSASRQQPPDENALDFANANRLFKGPAYDTIASSLDAQSTSKRPLSTEWPTYRHDATRSGSLDAPLPVELDLQWEVSLCPPAFPADDETVEERHEEATVLKALDATIHGPGAKKAGQAIIGWRGPDTYIEWQAEIKDTGKVPVWILQANMGRGGAVFELSVGPEKLVGEIAHTDNWEQYVWVRVGDVEITEPGSYSVSVRPLEQVEGRLGNVSAVAVGGSKPPSGGTKPPRLREHPVTSLTPPVAAEGRVFVVEPKAHTIHALQASDGKRMWSFVADGRVDSPPTIYRGLCLFGCTDGNVYCVSAADGQLVWRFRAAPEHREVCVRGQVESAWPVHGSVLVRDNKVYFTAGRSSFLDGGIYIYALDPFRGEILHKNVLRSDDPDVTKYGGRPFDMEGARSDLLVAGEEDIYLFQNRFGKDLRLKEMPRVTKLGDRKGEPRLMTTDGFLDTTWFNRTYWIHSERWPGYYFTYRAPKSGQILVFDEANTYSLKVYTERQGHSPEFRPGSGYQLIADRNSTKPVLDVMDIGAEKGRGFSRTELPIWLKRIPIRIHGMLLARDRLYVAGPPDLAPENGAYEAMIGKRGATFQVISTADGEALSEFKMEDVPVFDGLIASGDRLYVATMSGTLICYGGSE